MTESWAAVLANLILFFAAILQAVVGFGFNLLSSPLLLGNDLRSMNSTTLGIIRNKDVIDVNQDWGGSQGRRIRDDGTSEVWAKPMSDGSVAVVLFNRGSAAATTTSGKVSRSRSPTPISVPPVPSPATTTSTRSSAAAISAPVPS